MTCSRCGGEVPEGSQFCNHCGASNRDAGLPDLSHLAQKPARAPNRTIAILIPLILVLGAIAVYQALKSPREVVAPAGNETRSTSPGPEARPGESTTRSKEKLSMGSALTPAEFTVGPAGLRYFKITVGNNSRNASLVGKFSATGGVYNDIEVYVIVPDPSGNPGEGQYAKALYNSRRVTTQNLDVPLSAGEYYLVFNNTWSPSIKTVSANVGLLSQP